MQSNLVHPMDDTFSDRTPVSFCRELFASASFYDDDVDNVGILQLQQQQSQDWLFMHAPGVRPKHPSRWLVASIVTNNEYCLICFFRYRYHLLLSVVGRQILDKREKKPSLYSLDQLKCTILAVLLRLLEYLSICLNQRNSG